MLLVLVGLLLQLWGSVAIWTATADVLHLAALGGGALAIIVALVRIEGSGNGPNAWLYAVLILFAPPYGSVGAVALYLYRRTGNSTGLARDYAAYIDAETSTDEPDATPAGSSLDQMVQHELNVQSYMDIMRGSDRLLKKALIGRILSNWTPNAVSLLRVGLRDAEYEIRSYSSTALTAIESRMSDNLVQRRQQAEEDGNSTDHLRLAEAYLDYVDAGLLDEVTTEHYVTLAGNALEKCDFKPEDELYLRWASLRAQTAHAAGDHERERALCEDVLRVHPDHADTLRQLCELDFRQGHLRQLSGHAARLLGRISEDHPAVPAARLWTAAEAGRS